MGADVPVVRAFLIADIRGYTRFTAEHGDEAAADLAGWFAELTGVVVAESGGQLLELRGDEALVVFTSARSAARAALALRERCITETLEHPSAPLPVGIGLDVGEAVPLADGYRGAALNVAARLCARARAGEILATPELAHLAGAIPGGTFARGSEVSLKGVAEPVRLFRLAPDPDDTDRNRRFASLVAPPRTRARRRRALVAVVAVLALAVAAVLTMVATGGRPRVPASTDNVLTVVDPGRARVTAVIPLGSPPTAVTAAAGAVWVASQSDGTVKQVDPARRFVVDSIPVGSSPSTLVAYGNSLWVALSGAGAVAQLNTMTRTVVATVPVGNEPDAIAAGFGKLWAANVTDATVTRIDPATLATTTIHVGDSPAAITAGDGAVWVANRADDTVTPIDPVTLAVGSPIPVGAGPAALAVTPDAVWVADSLDRTVTRIDARTRQQVRLVVGNLPGALTPVGHAIWVSVRGDGRLVSIDTRTNRLRALATGSSPVASVPLGGRLWSAQQAFASTAHRGGTLVVRENTFLGSTPSENPHLDPQQSYNLYYDFPPVYDGLVRLAPVSDSAGYEIVPDLATALPLPSDDGLTYKFFLRSGISYADGREVHASDFVRGFRRIFTSGGYDQYPHSEVIPMVVGVPACAEHPQRCRLGIDADDTAGTVTFRLSQPDPDFLAELTLAYDTPAPPGTPEGDVLLKPYPGTGPYQFGPIEQDTSTKPPLVTAVTLVRNPHFHVWSLAAQPPGYPDQIRFEALGDPAGSVDAVLRGRADVVPLGPLGNEVATLRRRYPDQVQVTRSPFVQYAVVNLNRPPFSNVVARRALSLALDRTASHAGTYAPACRIVPTGYPGSTRGCPAGWSPRGNVAQARALAKHLPPYRGTVTLIVYDAPNLVRFAETYAEAARAIGYRTVIRPSMDSYGQQILDPNATWNIGAYAWGPDYPAPSQYYLPLFACPSAGRASHAPHKGPVLGLQCSPRRDADASAALMQQLTAPARAIQSWTRIYRALDEQVAVIPSWAQSPSYLLSKRVGNFQSHLIFRALFDQMWVR